MLNLIQQLAGIHLPDYLKIFEMLWYNIFRIIKFFKYVASTNIWINVKVLTIVNYLLIVSQLNSMLQIECDNKTSARYKS